MVVGRAEHAQALKHPRLRESSLLDGEGVGDAVADDTAPHLSSPAVAM